MNMVKIKVLVENTSVSPDFGHKHGVSFYIETEKHKLLFDLGQNDLFLKNAKKMNVDIKQVDTVIISHGHFDHAGALGLFLKENSTAKIYIKKDAFEKHYTKVLGLNIDIGLDEMLKENSRLVFTDDITEIDGELLLFSLSQEKSWGSKANKALLAKHNGHIAEDDFSHEQSLIITDKDKKILVSGCSHAGIAGIKAKAQEIINGDLQYAVGGFHLYNPTSKKYESDELIVKIANELNDGHTVYYTCHCTGKKAYEKMKTVLGGRLNYASAGAQFVF